MKKTLYHTLIAFIWVGMLLSSCSKKPDVEYTSTYKMAGEWFVEYYQDGSAISDHTKIITYNTADPAAAQIWVDDPDFWPFKSKMDIDYSNFSFKAMASTPNAYDAGKTLKVYEGKVLPGAGISKSGNAVDSIYLKVEFSDDPGTVYEIKGHQRTGFFEDEY